MRVIDTDNLLRIKEKRNYNKIDWNNSINCTINFNYDDIKGCLQIVSYDKENQKVKVKYNGTNYNIAASHLLKCNLGSILGTYSKDYRFKVGDIISDNHRNIKILDRIKIKDHAKEYFRKGYTYQCLKDGYIGNIYENYLIHGNGCPVCSNKKVMVGVNDMWTTNPELAKLLADPDDGYKYTYGSMAKLIWKCPNCGTIIKSKKICDVYNYGLSCPKCSDGISYPEKVMYNLLNELDVAFEYQYNPLWCKYKLYGKNKIGLYDYYIPSKQIIIEMDGDWHNEDNNISGQTVEESKQIDKIKDQLAKEHGINVIRINCSYHAYNIQIIKSNILKSQMVSIFNLSNIDWTEIDKISQKSLVKEICNCKKEDANISVSQISCKYKISPNTVLRYLKQGTKLGWCNYNPVLEHQKSIDEKKKKVKCITTNTFYNSVKEASNSTGVFAQNISSCCKGKYNYAGKLSDGTKLVWKFIVG